MENGEDLLSLIFIITGCKIILISWHSTLTFTCISLNDKGSNKELNQPFSLHYFANNGVPSSLNHDLTFFYSWSKQQRLKIIS